MQPYVDALICAWRLVLVLNLMPRVDHAEVVVLVHLAGVVLVVIL